MSGISGFVTTFIVQLQIKIRQNYRFTYVLSYDLIEIYIAECFQFF